MANYLILNQNQVFNGLGTLTYTVATAGQYNVQCQVTMPAGPAINSNVQGGNTAGIGANLAGGQLAVGGGSGMGLGSGPGGGGNPAGFTQGDQGTGHGGVGQGFGTTNNYPQPISAASNATANSPTTSQLAIIVAVNGVTAYTATTPAVVQSALQFKYGFAASANDSVTVVLSSSLASDNTLAAITSNVSISQGLI